MATIRAKTVAISDKTTYHLVRRAQAGIAGYLHFDQGDLAKYLERESFISFAGKLADHYFHRSKGLVIHHQVKELFLVHLIMAPIIQRLPLSAKYDWHRGHLLSWCRIKANGRERRFHFGHRIIDRDYRPEALSAGLERMGIHDPPFVEFALDIYRRHAGGTALKDQLAHQMFDPIILSGMREGYELRFANHLYRLEKEPFEASIDLRNSWGTFLEYDIRSIQHQGGRHLEIVLSRETLARFRENVKGILDSSAPPQHKCRLLENRIRDFVEIARWARSARPQIEELKGWLADRIRPLSGTFPEARHLSIMLVNLWFQRGEHRLFMKAPNLFLDPGKIDERIYIVFFSPFREVTP
jgi:hypothetical protein